MTPEPVTVELRRYDGQLVRRVRGWRLAERAGAIRIAIPFGSTFETAHGLWRPETGGVYYFWPGGWQNVCVIVQPSSLAVAFLYCDIITPPEVDGDSLRALDLDLDLIVYPDGRYEVHDEAEFAAHALQLHYPPDLVTAARAALDQLLTSLRRGTGLLASRSWFELDPDARMVLTAGHILE
ncbi:MAG: DUF402 domain-containing protein [Chloroflexi bacterium]|nr:DUF402 domain-containing protein [Chloroflexota bacterium]